VRGKRGRRLCRERSSVSHSLILSLLRRDWLGGVGIDPKADTEA
jgi:hypothetical protein